MEISTIFVISNENTQITSQAMVETQSGWDRMKRELKREEEDICVSLFLLLLYISFKPNIQVHKTRKISNLTSEMNYMINKKRTLQGIIF